MQLHVHLALAAQRQAELRREAQERRLAREALAPQRANQVAPGALRALMVRLHLA